MKFVEPFGLDAMKFVNSPMGKRLRLRGVNAKVVQGGVIRAGDVVRKVYQTGFFAGDARFPLSGRKPMVFPTKQKGE
jgi:hypothetical protein